MFLFICNSESEQNDHQYDDIDLPEEDDGEEHSAFEDKEERKSADKMKK